MKPNTLCALALTGALLFSPLVQADDTDYTDVWWNPQQSGWGLNLAHQDGRIYATLHAYGTNGAPLWYVAYLDKQDDGSFTGATYSFTSTSTTAPLLPGQTSATMRGTLTFVPGSASEGVIRYNIDGQQGEQSVKRFSLLAQPFPASNPVYDINVNNWSHATFTINSNCSSAFDPGADAAAQISVTPSTDPTAPTARIDLKVSVNNPTPSAGLVFKDYNCSITGRLISDGQLSRIDDAKYSCVDATSQQPVWTQLPVKVTNIRVSASQLEGFWNSDIPNLNVATGAQTGNCNQKGYFVFSDIVFSEAISKRPYRLR